MVTVKPGVIGERLTETQRRVIQSTAKIKTDWSRKPFVAGTTRAIIFVARATRTR